MTLLWHCYFHGSIPPPKTAFEATITVSSFPGRSKCIIIPAVAASRSLPSGHVIAAGISNSVHWPISVRWRTRWVEQGSGDDVLKLPQLVGVFRILHRPRKHMFRCGMKAGHRQVISENVVSRNGFSYGVLEWFASFVVWLTACLLMKVVCSVLALNLRSNLCCFH